MRVIAGIVLFASFSANAGELPPPDGEITIVVSKADTAQITGLNDMYLTDAPDADGATWVNEVCVFSPVESSGYEIKAIANVMADGSFGVMGQVPYNVSWQNNGGECANMAGGQHAQLVIDVPQESLQVASVGNYADSLMLVIAPN